MSNSLKSFARNSGHDVVLAAVLTLVWGTIFFWDVIGRKWPGVRLAIEALLGTMAIACVVALYGTIVYLILAWFKRRLQLRDAGALARGVHRRLSLGERRR